jgi:hypothetical protein
MLVLAVSDQTFNVGQNLAARDCNARFSFCRVQAFS